MNNSPVTRPEHETSSKAMALLTLMRPWQWTKNGFVLMPLLFSGQFSQSAQCLKAAIAFAAFCAISSAIYIINDVCDHHEDRQHPVKKSRPIASGAITPPAAIVLALALSVTGLAIAATQDWAVLLTVTIYFVITIAYSLGLKRVVILDVMTIAAGFVFRILAGSFAIAVNPSHWLVLCTIMLSLFLGFSKRRAELVTASESTDSPRLSRIVLDDYSIAFLDQIIPVVAAATIVCYALYTVDVRTLEVFGTRAMVITVPCVMYGLFRYFYIIYHLRQGEDPTRVLCRDIPTIINMVVWIILSLCVVICGSRMALFTHLN